MARFVMFLVISAAMMLGYSVHERGGELVIEFEPVRDSAGERPFAWELFRKLDARPGSPIDSSAFRACQLCDRNRTESGHRLRAECCRASL